MLSAWPQGIVCRPSGGLINKWWASFWPRETISRSMTLQSRAFQSLLRLKNHQLPLTTSPLFWNFEALLLQKGAQLSLDKILIAGIMHSATSLQLAVAMLPAEPNHDNEANKGRELIRAIRLVHSRFHLRALISETRQWGPWEISVLHKVRLAGVGGVCVCNLLSKEGYVQYHSYTAMRMYSFCKKWWCPYSV